MLRRSQRTDRRFLRAIVLVGCTLLSGCAAQPEALAPLNIAYIPSPHYRTGPREAGAIDAIVIHTTEGAYDESLSFRENHERVYRGTVRYFTDNDREVSAHFVIGPHGEITQMVDVADIAHTQTYYNARSIGIECAGWSARRETWTPDLLESLIELTARLAVQWNVAVVHPEGTAYEGPNATIDSGGNARFAGAGLVGHYQVQPWNRTDPGPHFPWDWFVERVRDRVATLE